jgi:hypothetical protein
MVRDEGEHRMTVHLRELNIDNLLAVCRGLPDDERDLWKRFSGMEYDADKIAVAYLNEHGWIIHNGDQPLAAAGFVMQRPGVWRTWMLATPLAWDPYGREVTRVVRDQIQKVLAEGIAHRIETVTLADRNRARDWYPKIGLQFEATHRKYSASGEDAVFYVAFSDAESG